MQTQNNKSRVIVYGGSFDPPHNGHKQIIEELIGLHHAQELWVIPCARRADKKFTLEDNERYDLLEDMFGKQPGVSINRIELDSGKMIPTYELIKSFEKNNPQKEFFFVIGSDLLQQLHTWRHPSQLKKEINFLIVQRQGYPINFQQLPVHYKILDIKPMKVSSTEVNKIIRDPLSSRKQKRKELSRLLSQKAIDLLIKKEIV